MIFVFWYAFNNLICISVYTCSELHKSANWSFSQRRNLIKMQIYASRVEFWYSFPEYTSSFIRWVVVCKTTGKEVAGPSQRETPNPAPQDECWMKNKNAFHSGSALFTPDQTSCYLSHIRLLLSVNMCAAAETRRDRDLFSNAEFNPRYLFSPERIVSTFLISVGVFPLFKTNTFSSSTMVVLTVLQDGLQGPS